MKIRFIDSKSMTSSFFETYNQTKRYSPTPIADGTESKSSKSDIKIKSGNSSIISTNSSQRIELNHSNPQPKPKKLDMDTTFLENHLSNRKLQSRTMWRNGIQEAIEIPNIQDVANIWKAKANIGGTMNDFSRKSKKTEATSPTKVSAFQLAQNAFKMKIVEN